MFDLRINPRGLAGPDSTEAQLAAGSGGKSGTIVTISTPVSRLRSMPARALRLKPMRLSVIWPELGGTTIVAVLIVCLLGLSAALSPDELPRRLMDWWSGPVQPPPQAAFGIGATHDQVRAVQGNPTAIQGSIWRYGKSEVYFLGGHVAGWRTAPATPLKTVPATPVRFASTNSQP